MTDRELLELSAKAAGMVFMDRPFFHSHGPGPLLESGIYWNPLTDDGDAIRLAAKLQMNVDANICFTEVCWVDLVKSETHCVNEDWGAGEEDDAVKMRYVRRAIVRAAAEIGKAMK